VSLGEECRAVSWCSGVGVDVLTAGGGGSGTRCVCGGGGVEEGGVLQPLLVSAMA
jgi:hypothetical protein